MGATQPDRNAVGRLRPVRSAGPACSRRVVRNDQEVHPLAAVARRVGPVGAFPALVFPVAAWAEVDRSVT